MRERRELRDSVGVLAVAPAEAARLAGVGRTTIYEAIGAGALKSVKIGKAPADHHRSTEGVAACARGCRVTASRAAVLAQALGGRRRPAARGWRAVPAHDDREPSSRSRMAEGKVLVRCHAGCDQHDVIAALRNAASGKRLQGHPFALRNARQVRGAGRRCPEVSNRSERALAIWRQTDRRQARRSRLSPLARARHSVAAFNPLPCRAEASLGRRLAGDGGARDARA